MFRTARHILRLFAILRTLSRCDALFMLDRWPTLAGAARVIRRLPGFSPPARVRAQRPGQRLAQALEALGPGFIKFGQGLSTRTDIIGAEIAADLAALQDRLPPFSSAAARDAIAAELGAPVEDLFIAFEDEAVAAASIAQVHFAIVEHEDGTTQDVAVKILRPGIEEAFERDLDLLIWLASLAERFAPSLQRLKPVASVNTIAETVRIEMDLRMEAAAAEELNARFKDSPIYAVPRVHWPLTARRVMTASRIEGIPIHDVKGLVAQGHDLEAIVGHSAEIFFTQVFKHGFFHADMHPGNLFVGADGGLIAVDFGIMGRVDAKTRNYLADILVGFLSGDYKAVANVHFRAGLVPADKDKGAFEQALRAIGDPILERPSHEISIARLLAQLFQVTEQFEMEAQPQLLLLQKTMFLAEGVGRTLAPNANMWMLARPLVEDWVRTHRGPEARMKEWVEDAVATVALLPAVIRRLAEDVDKPTSVKRPIWSTTWPLWTVIAVLALLLIAG